MENFFEINDPFKGQRYEAVVYDSGATCVMECVDLDEDGDYILYEDAMREIEAWREVKKKLTKELDKAWDTIFELKEKVAGQADEIKALKKRIVR